MTPEEKKPFVLKSQEDKKRYEREKAVYLKRRSEMGTIERMALLEEYHENLRRQRLQDEPNRRVIFEPPDEPRAPAAVPNQPNGNEGQPPAAVPNQPNEGQPPAQGPGNIPAQPGEPVNPAPPNPNVGGG